MERLILTLVLQIILLYFSLYLMIQILFLSCKCTKLLTWNVLLSTYQLPCLIGKLDFNFTEFRWKFRNLTHMLTYFRVHKGHSWLTRPLELLIGWKFTWKINDWRSSTNRSAWLCNKIYRNLYRCIQLIYL